MGRSNEVLLRCIEEIRQEPTDENFKILGQELDGGLPQTETTGETNKRLQDWLDNAATKSESKWMKLRLKVDVALQCMNEWCLHDGC